MKKLTFILLCIEGAILSFNVAACAALVPSIAKEFTVEPFIAGRITWLYMLPYGVAALLYGPLVRVIDAKKIELTCLVLFSAANLLAALSKNIETLFLARFLMGLFGASVIPLALILIANAVDPKQKGRFVGIFFSATFVASLFGLFLSGLIDWRWLFLIPAVAGFIAVIALWLYLPSFKPTAKKLTLHYKAAFQNRKIVYIFVYIFFISLLYHGVQQWLGVYFASNLGLTQFIVSMLITLTSLSGILGEVLGGWLSDTLGRFKTMNLGLLCMIAGACLLIVRMPLVMLALIMIIWGIGWTLNHAGVSTMLTDLPKEFLNEAASLNSSVRFISGGIGVALGGFVFQQSFMLGFIFFGLSLLSILFASRKLIMVRI